MKKIFSFLTVAIFVTLGFTVHRPSPGKTRKIPGNRALMIKPAADETLVKRGEYLVTIMGCADCHSPKKFTDKGPVPDPERFMSGYNAAEKLPPYDQNLVKKGQWVLFNGHNTAIAGPWGVSFAANLTPDASGIGTWTLEQFGKALRQGKYRGLDNTRPMLPPMPWPNYINLKDEDLKAMFAYLMSLKPISNVVPAPIPPTP